MEAVVTLRLCYGSGSECVLERMRHSPSRDQRERSSVRARADEFGFHDQGWLAIFGHMDVQIKIDDSQAYRNPFTLTQTLVFLPDTDLLEYLCSENERGVRHFVFK
jgi:hypothetical protein